MDKKIGGKKSNGSFYSNCALTRQGSCHLVCPGGGDLSETLCLGVGRSSILLEAVNVFPCSIFIGVRAEGARGAAAPPNFGQLRFFGQQEKIWAKPVFKDVSMFFFITLKRQIFSILI